MASGARERFEAGAGETGASSQAFLALTMAPIGLNPLGRRLRPKGNQRSLPNYHHQPNALSSGHVRFEFSLVLLSFDTNASS